MRRGNLWETTVFPEILQQANLHRTRRPEQPSVDHPPLRSAGPDRSTTLQRYLTRIGVPGASTPDLPTLAAIVAGHTRSIPFENLDPFTGRDVSLDAAALTAKLVDNRRGGWCFEHNNLLRNVLDELGYRTTALAARVDYNKPANAPPGARTHMVLRIDGLPGGPHIVDVGFGGLTLTGVLRLEPDLVQATPHGSFRMRQAGPHLAMEALVAQTWLPLYRFDLTDQLLIDFEVMNFYLGHHPGSAFRHRLMLARVEADRRFGLSDTTLSVRHLDGRTERTQLGDIVEVRAALERCFLIDLTGLASLDERLQDLINTRS